MISPTLLYFTVVAKHEHIGHAAEELGMSQPALSRSIARLEKQCGAQLFDRLGRGLRLNSAGRILLRHVQSATAELEDAVDEIREQRADADQTISIGFLGTFGVALIPDLIRGFKARCAVPPRFRLLQGSLPFLLEKIVSREIHLCVSGPRFLNAALEWRPLYEESLFAVVAAGDPLAHRGEIDLIELSAGPMIALKAGYGLRKITDAVTQEAGFAPIIAFEAEEVATLRGLVGAGVGWTIAPAPVLEATGLTVDLKVRSPACRRVVGLSWRKDRHLPAATRTFRDYVLERYAGLTAAGVRQG